MKYFPFKILLLCILLPPLCYMISIKFLEWHFQKKFLAGLEQTYTGDTKYLFDGTHRLQDVISKNIEQYLHDQKILAYGMKLDVTVTTSQGFSLYPGVFQGQQTTNHFNNNSMTIASENFRLLNLGLLINAKVSIEHNSVISNVILIFYLLVSILVLQFFYKSGLGKYKNDEMQKQMEIKRLFEVEKKSIKNLTELEEHRRKLENMRTELKSEKQKVVDTEDEMMDELISLENRIQENILLEKDQRHEISELKEKLDSYEKKKQEDSKTQIKAMDLAEKRFSTLYKNLKLNNRAFSGYVNLPDDMKIKAEEIIHQLNSDPKQVSVKRKVFGKKNRETVFEVIFSYKGRLYFRNINNSIEILAVGTKQTQSKDLLFLDRL